MLQHVAEVDKTKAVLLGSLQHYEKCFQTACAEKCQLTEKVDMLSSAAQVIFSAPILHHSIACNVVRMHHIDAAP